MDPDPIYEMTMVFVLIVSLAIFPFLCLLLCDTYERNLLDERKYR